MIKFIKEAYIELRKVTWPSKQQVINYTIVVIIVSVAVAIFLGMLDMGFSSVIENILKGR